MPTRPPPPGEYSRVRPSTGPRPTVDESISSETTELERAVLRALKTLPLRIESEALAAASAQLTQAELRAATERTRAEHAERTARRRGVLATAGGGTGLALAIAGAMLTIASKALVADMKSAQREQLEAIESALRDDRDSAAKIVGRVNDVEADIAEIRKLQGTLTQEWAQLRDDVKSALDSRREKAQDRRR